MADLMMNPLTLTIAETYRRMVAANTLDAAGLLVRRDWKPRPTFLAQDVLQARQQLPPTWLQRQLATR